MKNALSIKQNATYLKKFGKVGAVLITALAVHPVIAGGVYKWVDSQGAVHYSDTPPPSGAQAKSSAVAGPSTSAVSQTSIQTQVTWPKVNYKSHWRPLSAVKGLTGSGIGGTVSPKDLYSHYGFPTTTLKGAGQVIAIVDAPGSGNIANDLNAFSSYYGLPQCNSSNACFQKIDLSNGAAVSPSNDWNVEIGLDVEWAHAMAPAAKIILVIAKSSSLPDMMAAVQKAATQAGVVAVSMSWGGNEFSQETTTTYDGVLASYVANAGMIFFASAGDSGNNGSNQIWPAASPYVTAVGGTSIYNAAAGQPTATTETAWVDSGGGPSIDEKMPAYQTSYLSGSTSLTLNKGKRAIPDVAYDADPNTSPVAVVAGGYWYAVGGTSAGSPQWAAIASLIANHRTATGKSGLASLVKGASYGFNSLIYQAKIDPTSFFDVTKGSDNTGRGSCAICGATTGYDDVTGLGVPHVGTLVGYF
jgi:subtilase family serine protease